MFSAVGDAISTLESGQYCGGDSPSPDKGRDPTEIATDLRGGTSRRNFEPLLEAI